MKLISDLYYLGVPEGTDEAIFLIHVGGSTYDRVMESDLGAALRQRSAEAPKDPMKKKTRKKREKRAATAPADPAAEQ